DPTRPGVIYAAFSTMSGTVIATTRTRDDEQVVCSFPHPGVPFGLRSLTVGPDGTIYAGTALGLDASDDCETWRPVGTGSPPNTTVLAFDPLRPSTIW